MPPRRRKRLDPSVFNIPVEQVKQGYYTDAYFIRAREVLRHDKRHTMPSVISRRSVSARWSDARGSAPTPSSFAKRRNRNP
jgi:hypothetical protein